MHNMHTCLYSYNNNYYYYNYTSLFCGNTTHINNIFCGYNYYFYYAYSST